MSRETLGLILGFIGVCIFAGTLPFTRLAIETLSPWFISAGRAALAGLLAGATLLVLRRPVPQPKDVGALVLSALCLVAGFPVLTALAMETVPASHRGVVLGILPLSTALISVLLAGERPRPAFWIAAVAGAALVTAFALREGEGGLQLGDLYLLGAVLSSSLGYVVSGKLTQSGLAGWEVISWILVVSLPVTAPLAVWLFPEHPAAVPALHWFALLYVSLMSQYIGFFAWNAGLAIGGIARVSQVQLLQTFLTLAIAALLNREPIEPVTWAVAAMVLMLVLIARRTASAKPAGGRPLSREGV
ncbi:DMT family transporter [Microvirga massiliensis]|uniref:DMT family transporter n=1 Tax=Microvirga massiliensis TaxID=1033741 RepID=UPI00062BCEFA|nr:DMT family transporter [Microvirga massiliensis]